MHMPVKQILVPDIGNFKDVDVIEVMAKPGDTVRAEDALITLETDKATMDVQSPFAGVVKEMKIKAGDKVSQGALIALVETSEETAAKSTTSASAANAVSADVGRAMPAMAGAARPTEKTAAPAIQAHSPDGTTSQVAGYDKGGAGEGLAHASPSIRRFARELCEERALTAARCGRRRLAGGGIAGSGLRTVWPDRNQAAVAYPENIRRESAPQLGDHSACHAVQRGRHHRDGSLPQTAERGIRRAGRQNHAAGVSPQGGNGSPAKVSGIQRLAGCRRRKSGREEIHSHRCRRRYAGRPDGAGDSRRGPKRHRGACQRAR